MPRHVTISPEEDLSTYYADPALRGAGVAAQGEAVPVETLSPSPMPEPGTAGAAAPPPAAGAAAPPPAASAAAPPPVPPSAVSAPASPPLDATLDGTTAGSAPAKRLPGQLAPVQRPMPTFPATPPPPAPPVAPASPMMAMLLSLLVPGAGQIYLGQTRKGGVILAVGLLTCFGVFTAGIVNLLAAGDAWLLAHRRNGGEDLGPWSSF